jgi:hypothetical protein
VTAILSGRSLGAQELLLLALPLLIGGFILVLHLTGALKSKRKREEDSQDEGW